MFSARKEIDDLILNGKTTFSDKILSLSLHLSLDNCEINIVPFQTSLGERKKKLKNIVLSSSYLCRRSSQKY